MANTPAATLPPRRSRDPLATREALLAAGTDAFATAGFDGATLDQIARRAGVNKAMISYHFGGKLGLYRAILEGIVGGATERFESADPSVPAGHRLRLLIADLSRLMQRRPSFPVLMLRELLAGAPRIDPATFAHFYRLAGLTREIVDAGTASGELREVGVMATFFSLIGSLAYFHATAGARRRLAAIGLLPLDVPDVDAFVAHLQELFGRGLAHPEIARRSR